jgi:hypothetical protein
MKRRLVPWVVSGALHVGLGSAIVHLAPATSAPTPPSVGAAPARSLRTEPMVRPVFARAERALLVLEAREARARGRLSLGDFLVRAGEIDAREDGVTVDAAAAQASFDAYRDALRVALAHAPTEQAVPTVFSDLRYTGTPGGRAVDALLRHEGSCEPLSQIVAAALHDAGLGDRAKLRFYGGAVAGVTHLAPTIEVDGREHDLMAGTTATAGGASFVASELVEVYARVHGLAPPLPSVASGGPRAADASDATGDAARPMPPTRTLTSGFPPNAGRFTGGLPLFAEQAIATPRDPRDAEKPDPDASGCPALPAALLDPPRLAVIGDDGQAAAVDLVRIPSQKDLALRSQSIVALEQARSAPGAKLADRIAADACLAGLYDQVATGFSLSREPTLAARAIAGGEAARDDARQTLASLQSMTPKARGTEILSALIALDGRAYVLLFLDDFDDLALELAKGAPDAYWRVELVTGLLIAPRTRERAVALADGLPLSRQIDVMHELTHAHDHARPWASSYALELPSDAPESVKNARFVRAYRVLRPVAWSLWEAQREPAATVLGLVAGAKEQKLDPEAISAVAGYYERNFWWLYQHRDGGPAQIAALEEALERHGLRGAAGDKALTPGELGSARNSP